VRPLLRRQVRIRRKGPQERHQNNIVVKTLPRGRKIKENSPRSPEEVVYVIQRWRNSVTSPVSAAPQPSAV